MSEMADASRSTAGDDPPPTAGNLDIATDDAFVGSGRSIASFRARKLIPRENDANSVTEPLMPMPQWLRVALLAWLAALIALSLTTLISSWPAPADNRAQARADSLATVVTRIQTFHQVLAPDAANAQTSRLLDSANAGAGIGADAKSASDSGKPSNDLVLFGLWHLGPNPERVLFVLVIFSGLLGGATHGLASLMNFRGNRRLFKPWAMWYAGMPLTGASVAAVFMLVLRGGLLPNREAVNSLNPFALAGAAALAGLFSDMATAKLKEVLLVLFGVTDKRKDKLSTAAPSTSPGTGSTIGGSSRPSSAAADSPPRTPATAETGTGSSRLPAAG